VAECWKVYASKANCSGCMGDLKCLEAKGAVVVISKARSLDRQEQAVFGHESLGELARAR
jgi:hypothetical protein